MTSTRESTLRAFAVAGTVLPLLSACVSSYAISPSPTAGRSCPQATLQGGGQEWSWYFPVPARDNRRLEEWCETVGPPVVDSIPRGGFGSLEPGDPLMIASWNVDAGAGDLPAFIRETLGLDCEAGPSGHAGASHFIVLVQEALRRSNEIPDLQARWSIPPPVQENDRPGPRRDVVDVARACGLALAYVPAARNGPEPRNGLREDKGNAILSTLPLSDLIAIELPYEAARRVVVAATVRDAAGDSLRVASVHLLALPAPWRLLTTGNSSRLRESLATIEALNLVERERGAVRARGHRAPGPGPEAGGRRSAGETSPASGPATESGLASGPTAESGPAAAPTRSGAGQALGTTARAGGISTLLAGDLNTWSRRENSLRRLREHFPESPSPLDEATRGPFPTDHILFRAGRSAGTSAATLIPETHRRVDEAYGSDHHPILVRLRFAETGANRARRAANAGSRVVPRSRTTP